MNPFGGSKFLTRHAASFSLVALLTALSIGLVTKAEELAPDAGMPSLKETAVAVQA